MPSLCDSCQLCFLFLLPRGPIKPRTPMRPALRRINMNPFLADLRDAWRGWITMTSIVEIQNLFGFGDTKHTISTKSEVSVRAFARILAQFFATRPIAPLLERNGDDINATIRYAEIGRLSPRKHIPIQTHELMNNADVQNLVPCSAHWMYLRTCIACILKD